MLKIRELEHGLRRDFEPRQTPFILQLIKLIKRDAPPRRPAARI
jgi:hypothetical protein